MDRWWRRAAAIFLLVQLVLPLRQLARERPARWGWQMFSAPPALTEVRVDHQDGVEVGPPVRFLAVHRHEIRATRALADRLCAAREGAVRIRLVRNGRVIVERDCR